MTAPNPEITKPVRIDTEALVQNVYAGTSGLPDNQSQSEFSQYLVDRMYGVDDPVATSYTPGAEVPGETRRRFDGWRITPRKALAITVAGLLALNVAVNYKSIGGKLRETFGDIKHQVDPDVRVIPGETKEGKTVTRTLDYPIGTIGQEQRSGVAQRDVLSARGLVRKLKSIENDGKIVNITVTAGASDERTANGVKSVGKEDKANVDLALERAENLAESIETEAEKENLDFPDIQIEAKEHVLNDEELGELLASVQKSKYRSVLEAISAYNNGDDTMSDSLRSMIGQHIGSKRRGVVSVTVQQTETIPGEPTIIPAHEEEVPRDDEKHPFTPIPFFFPPIPRFTREYRDPFQDPPTILEEPLDKVWIELYEEALKSNGELVDNAWSLSRKYQALYREERITQGIRFDYLDDEGKQQFIDILFADRPELTDEVIQAVSGLIFDISMMQDGKVGDALDTIVVFPTEQTGSQRPDKIGLGIDEQFHKNVLGVAIPVIGLSEIHLPLKPKEKDIQSFVGFRQTLAHEIAGHFTDVNKQARFIDPSKSNRPGRTFRARNPWLGAGNDGYASTARRGTVRVHQFAIPHPNDEPGEYIVNAGSQELIDAPSARLHGESPTRYSDESAAELHAEVAAALTTGMLVPVSELGINSKALGEKTGYSVDGGLQHRFVTHVGAIANVDGLQWDPERAQKRRESFKVSILRGVLELNGHDAQNSMSEGAKTQPYQEDERRLKILAGIRR